MVNAKGAKHVTRALSSARCYFASVLFFLSVVLGTGKID